MNIDDTLMEAQARQHTGELEQARACFLTILEAESDNADALYGLGTVHLQQGDVQEACRHLRRAVVLMPDIPEFVCNLGLAEWRAGRMDAAVAHLQRAAMLAAGDIGLLVRICGKLLAMGRDREVLEVVAASSSRDPAILALAARARARVGDWAGACAALRKVVAANPHDPRALRELATAAAKLREYATAVSTFEDYLRLVADAPADQLAYADLLLMARRPEEAAMAIQRAMDRGADDVEAQYLAARCDRLAGDYAAARQRLREATAERPGFGSAWWLLVDLEDATAGLEEIAETCRRLARDSSMDGPQSVLLALSAGRALERLERYDEAFAEFDYGNGQQRAQLSARDAAYKPAAMEAFVTRMSQLFPRPLPAPSSREPVPIFIVGLPRSGTTVVERMLASLAGVEAGGENEAMEFVAAHYYWELECGRLPAPGQLSPDQRHALVAEYWRRTGGEPRRLTDKLPHNFRNVGLIGVLFPNAPIIYMHRDARDVALSIYGRPFPDGHAYACDLKSLGHFFAQAERLHDHWRRITGQRLLDVRYEQLVNDPEPLTRTMAEFCGLRWDPACLAFHEHTDSAFTFSELQVREALHDRGVGRWRRYEEHLQPFLESYGRASTG